MDLIMSDGGNLGEGFQGADQVLGASLQVTNTAVNAFGGAAIGRAPAVNVGLQPKH